MGKYVRKTRDRWDIETNVGYGWEVESSYYNRKEARVDYQGYLEYTRAYGGTARIVKRREKICPTQANV